MSVVVMSAVFRHSESKGSARLVLLAIADVANDEGEVSAYARSQLVLARKANVSRASVQRAIDQLVQIGELTITSRGDGRVSSSYQVQLPGLIEGHQDDAPGASPRARRGITVSTQGHQGDAPISPSSSVADRPDTSTRALLDVEHSFDSFWREYPRKIGKPKARRAFDRALRTSSVEQITAGLKNWCAYWKARNAPEFVPHPSTWLNEERWNDEPPKANVKQLRGPGWVADPEQDARERAMPTGRITEL